MRERGRKGGGRQPHDTPTIRNLEMLWAICMCRRVKFNCNDAAHRLRFPDSGVISAAAQECAPWHAASRARLPVGNWQCRSKGCRHMCCITFITAAAGRSHLTWRRAWLISTPLMKTAEAATTNSATASEIISDVRGKQTNSAANT